MSAPSVDPVRQVALDAWTGRFATEVEASARFASLAWRLRQAHAPHPVVSLAERASDDERRHAAHCQRYVSRLGGVPLSPSSEVVEYAPRSLDASQRLTYEMVAQCCVAETVSTSTLVTLAKAVDEPELHSVIHELARDEVNHGKLGWGYLAWARTWQELSFLGPLLPTMLDSSTSRELFGSTAPSADDPELYRYGVIPLATRRDLYVTTLEEVVFPGFEQHGIDTSMGWRWLRSRRGEVVM